MFGFAQFAQEIGVVAKQMIAVGALKSAPKRGHCLNLDKITMRT